MSSAARLVIPVQVELGLEVGQSETVGEELEREVAAGLAEMIDRLELAGEPAVEVRQRVSSRPVHIRVHRSPVPYRAALLQQVWRMAAPPALRDLPEHAQSADGGPPDAWLAEYLGDLGKHDLGAAVGYLVRLVVEAIRERAGCLIGPAQAADHLGEGGEHDAALLVLRALLDEGMSLGGHAHVITGLLAAGREVGRPMDETVEVVRNQFPAPRVEVHLDPGAFALLLPQQRERASLVHDATESLRAVVASIEEKATVDYGVRLPRANWMYDHQLPAGCLALKVNEHLRPPVPVVGDLDDVWRLGPAVEASLYAELAQVVDRFITVDSVEDDLARLEEAFPDLVRAVTRRFRVTTVTRLLRELLREDVSVRDLRNLLERLLLFDTVPVDPSEYEVFDWRLPMPADDGPARAGWPDHLRWVRERSRDLLSAKYADDGALAVVILAPELERMAVTAAREREAAGSETVVEALRDAVWSTVGAIPAGRKPPLLTHGAVRGAVREILAPELPDLPVLARSELWPHLDVTPLAVITPR